MARKRKNKPEEIKSRKSLSKMEEITLWVASGAQCAICKKKLIFESSRVYINIADKAHIIAHSGDGPRGEYSLKDFSLTDEDLDSIRNIVLLCKDHHHIVDTNPTNWTVDKLFKIKHEHEAHIRAKLDCNQAALAIIHKTMDDTPVAIDLVNDADALILGKAEYQKVFDDFTPEGWKTAKTEVETLYQEVKEAIKLNVYSRVCVFPLSHIPLLVYLGFLIGDKIPVSTFQYSRDANHWVGCNPDGKTRIGELQVVSNTRGKKQLIVSISVSAPVHQEDIAEALEASLEDYDELHISVDNPKIDSVLYVEEVKLVQNRFKYGVEEMHGQNRYEEIHLFLAVPAGLAVEIGRSINANMWCEVITYNYRFREIPKYKVGVKI
ncbi:MAG: SAVED domain-containing protein [Bacillota bacterium]